MNKGIHDATLCYLTEKAQAATLQLVGLGLDQDLAISVLEQLWPEDEIYELPAREEHGAAQ